MRDDPLGVRDALRSVGALLERIENRHVHGWLYQAVRPIGAPPEPRGLPPRFIFKLLLALHPELRRRVRRATEVWEETPWRTAATRE